MTPLLPHFNLFHFALLFTYVVVLGFFFAKVEIQIEGSAGWATSLPTWRIEQHLLLTLFWGGRAMTGYHAWVFTFIALLFHFPMVMVGELSWLLEARVLASIMLFWVIEDFLWFVLNPDFGLSKFSPQHAFWHKNWVMGAPVEYWIATSLGLALMAYSYCV